LYLLFLPPPSLSIDPETTAADVAVYGYVVDAQIISTELPGKPSLPF
jgi:hypothetical protein